MSSTETNTAGETFKVGATYSTGEGRDYVWRFRVVARTAKFITIVDADTAGETKRVGVFTGYAGHEAALPLGRYSMAPTISADAELVELEATDPGNTTPDPTRWGPETGERICTAGTHELAVVRCAGCGEFADNGRNALAAAVSAEHAAREANRLEVLRLAELVGADQ